MYFKCYFFQHNIKFQTILISRIPWTSYIPYNHKRLHGMLDYKAMINYLWGSGEKNPGLRMPLLRHPFYITNISSSNCLPESAFYTIYWILQSVQRHLEKYGHTARIPSHTRQKITRLQEPSGFTPLFYSAGLSNPPDIMPFGYKRNESDLMYVTYQYLIDAR